MTMEIELRRHQSHQKKPGLSLLDAEAFERRRPRLLDGFSACVLAGVLSACGGGDDGSQRDVFAAPGAAAQEQAQEGRALSVDGGAATAESEDLGAALSAVESTQVDTDGVVRYTFDPKTLPSAQVLVQQGSRTAKGECVFQRENTGQADDSGPRITVLREIEFNPSLCRRRLAMAQYTRSTAPSALLAKLDNPSGAASSAASPDSSSATVEPSAAAARWYIGSLKVNVEDPPQIDVTSTKSRVEWTGTSCVTASRHNAYWGWFSPSGWRRTNASWANDRSCARAYTDTYGKYRNGTFCATIDTWTTHHKTWFEGRPGGGWAWSYKVTKSGGCTALLHYEYIVETP
jgi:hypothetical protein